MCGILGAVPSVEKNKFQKALNLLAHRGPDGEGIWQDGERAILGHRRLAILDVSSLGNQPMQYGGRYNIVFNGEIYNFLEIRQQLQTLGHKFCSDSDTEVLLAAFAAWGPSCLNRLNGMWAFAIWDSTEQKLFLSRDRLGKKPLYYLLTSKQLIFASEQKALLPYLDEVAPAENFHSLSKNSYAYESHEECLFKGIKRFPAAHYAWLDTNNNSLKKVRYWSVLDNPPTIPKKYEDQVEQLRELLKDACSIRMRSDVPIGTGLSGGVDSSAIAATVAEVGKNSNNLRLAKSWQNSFVASFPGTVMNESHYAALVAKHLGIHHTEIIIRPEQYADQLEKWAYLSEDIHEVNPIPHFALYKAMREHGVVVTLDGHGGDELFCGYESSVLHALPEAFGNSENFHQVLNTYHELHPKNNFFKGLSSKQIAWYLFKAKGRMILQEGLWQETCLKSNLGALNAHLYELTFRTVFPTLLRNYDRYSMVNGVEIRMPLVDHRIVNFAFALPWQSKLKNGFTKSILRDVVAPWLPEEVIRRKTKIGFAPPILDWMRGPLKEYLLDEIESKSFKEANLIDAKAESLQIKNLINNDGNNLLYTTEQTWKQFNIYLWEKSFIQKQLWKI